MSVTGGGVEGKIKKYTVICEVPLVDSVIKISMNIYTYISILKSQTFNK